MIERERLEELIKQEAMIYCIGDFGIRDFCLSHCFDWRINNCELWQGYEPFEDIKNLYETKEKAEFVAKNHDTRIEKFEPPFELKDEQTYYFNDKNGFKNVISFDKGSKVGDEDVYIIFSIDFYNSFILRYRTNDYAKAVDYAHKLFKGEE